MKSERSRMCANVNRSQLKQRSDLSIDTELDNIPVHHSDGVEK